MVFWRFGVTAAKTTRQSSLLGMAQRDDGKVEKIETTLDSTLESIDKAEAMVTREAHKAGFDEDEQAQIGMAVRECMVNAVVHGNRYSSKKKIHFEIERSVKDLTVVVGDEGEGFDLNSLPDPLAPENILRQSGRGILLIRSFMDEFDLHPRPGGGTEVRLVKNVAKSAKS